ncbi:RNA methyltransferase, RsmD family [Campylobacter pinnipediorum subsp. pinnipediorum]|uniref:16S rRNA (guanine(966)-N(2))-methyltransferase RsmD n=1 Tax=Campylobacter pinnipediorum TaxID=1965231 RepID=UPI0009959241|nr:16S rRNA (guanine(966)-N(2))-methyltransferase RsmD [Campylobacter pinnipediorum]AQW84657.1 RNA methyltransferase, RsmD family [Campylobacter pinnipediorum subsp. pinnipediorum]
MSKIFTTISSGKFKGKKLELPSLKTTRSTKSIVKESFFNSVRYELRPLVFIEGFGGSGVMACEAFSNGVKNALAIEIDNEAFKLTQKNLNSIDNTNLKAIKGDSFKLLPEIINKSSDKVLLYLDPPFDFRDGFKDIYNDLIVLISSLNKQNIYMIVFEHSSDFKFEESLATFKLIKTKKFGATTLSYFI